MERLKKYIILLIIILCSAFTFAELSQAPNTLITENPDKEVTTVEAPKNREHAEMNITVNKLIPKEIEGYKVDKTEYYIELPKNEKLEENEVYFITKRIEDLPDISSVNGKKIIANLKKFENYSMETDEFSYIIDKKYIIIDKAPLDIEKFFITKINKNSGEISGIYEANKFVTAPVIELEGKITSDNSKIIFQLDNKILEEIKEKELRIGKTLKDIFHKKTRFVRNLNNDILNYELNEKEKILSIENRDLDTIRMLVMNDDKIERVYIGKPRFIEVTDTLTFGNDGWDTVVNSKIKNKLLIAPDDKVKIMADGISEVIEGTGSDFTNPSSLRVPGSRLYSFPALYLRYVKEGNDSFIRLTRNVNVLNYNRKVTVEVYSKEGVLKYKYIINNLKLEKKTKAEIQLNKPLVKADEYVSSTYGWMTIGPDAERITPAPLEVGILDSTGKIPSSSYKNGQFNTIAKSGSINSLNLLGYKAGETFKIKVNGHETDIRVVNPDSQSGNPVETTELNTGTSGLKMRLDYESTSKIGKGGVYLAIDKWDYQKHDVEIEIITKYAINNISLKIPALELKSYYDETKDKGTVTLTTNDFTGEGVLGTIDVGMKDYDLQILGKGNYSHLGLFFPFCGTITGKAALPDGTEVEVPLTLSERDIPEYITHIVWNPSLYSSLLNVRTGRAGENAGYTAKFDVKIDTSGRRSVKSKDLERLFSQPRFIITVDKTSAPEGIIWLKHTGIEKVEKVIDKLVINVNRVTNNTEVVEITGKDTITTTKSFIGLDASDNITITVDGETPVNIKGNALIAGYTIPSLSSYTFTSVGDKIKVVKKGGDLEKGINKKITFEAKSHEGLSLAKFVMENFIDRLLGEVTVTLKNPLVETESSRNYGWIKIYPNSTDDKTAKVGYLLEDASIAGSTIKNGQFTSTKAEGTIAPFIQKDNSKIKVTSSAGENKIINIGTGNPIVATDINVGNNIKSKIDYERNESGVYFSLEEWNLVGKSFWVQVEGETFRNKISFVIPDLDMEVYYDKTKTASIGTLDYGAKKVSNTIIEDSLNSKSSFLGGELARFEIGTKDLDLRILGNSAGTNNLRIEIPKTIPVEFKSNGIKTTDNLSVVVKRKGNITNVRQENEKYIIELVKGIDGVTTTFEPTENSDMLAEVSILWDSSRNILSNINSQNIRIIGDNLGLVKIGVPGKMDWTIFDKVEFKIETQNYDLKFDIKEINAPENEIVSTPNPTIEFNLNNKIEIYDKVTNSVVYKGTGESLQNIGWKNEEFGATLKYSNSNGGFVVNKFKNIDYDKKFIMYIKSINGVVLRTVNLHLINSDGFEIIDGHGKLDFGDFFSGDIKQAEDIIRFKDIHNAKINIEMESPTTEMSKLDVSSPTADQKIQVRKLEAYDLNTQNKNENHFKIKGEAVTTPTTEVGKYRGTAEVIITIIP